MNLTYMRARRTAERMIKKYGGKFYRQDFNGYVTWDSTVVTFDQDTPFVYAVILPVAKEDEFAAESGAIMDLSMFRKFLMSTEGMSERPQPHQQIMYQNVWWTIQSIVPLNPDGDLDIFHKGMLQRV